MGRSRDTVWIDLVSRPSSTSRLFRVRELSLPHEILKITIFPLTCYTGYSSSVTSSVAAMSCSAHLRQRLIAVKIGKTNNRTLFLVPPYYVLYTYRVVTHHYYQTFLVFFCFDVSTYTGISSCDAPSHLMQACQNL